MKKNKHIKQNKQIKPKVVVKQSNNNFSQRLPYFFIILFAVLLAIGMYYHELWRDELEIYGKVALTGNIQWKDYSCILYNLLLKMFLLFSKSQTMYQFYHFVIIVSAIFLLNRYSPFTLFEKFFFTFSYFLFYEYGIISRYYGFIILLLFIITYLLSRKKVNYYYLIIPLIILASHTVNSFGFALAIFFFIINDIFKKVNNKTLDKKIIIAYSFVFLYFLFIGFVYLAVTTKAKTQFEGLAAAPIFMTIRTIWNSFIPLPEFTDRAIFWNTNFFKFPMFFPLNFDINAVKTPQNLILSVLSLFIFIVILIKFSKKPVVFWLFLFNYSIQLIFLHIARFYFIRHQGLLFIIFIYSYWLYYIADENIYIPIFNKIKLNVLSNFKIDKLFKFLISIFLLCQFISAFYAFSKDIKFKFTLSHDAAEYIKYNNLDKDHVLVGCQDFAAQAIAINLEKKMYFPQSMTYDYCWDPLVKNYNKFCSNSDILNACINYTEKQNKKVLLILNISPLIDTNTHQPLTKGMLSQNSSIELLQSFTGDIIQPDEQYWLYEIIKIKN